MPARMTIFIVAFYFPLFYLQLDALSHGLSRTFSFYAVSRLESCLTLPPLMSSRSS